MVSLQIATRSEETDNTISNLANLLDNLCHNIDRHEPFDSNDYEECMKFIDMCSDMCSPSFANAGNGSCDGLLTSSRTFLETVNGKSKVLYSSEAILKRKYLDHEATLNSKIDSLEQQVEKLQRKVEELESQLCKRKEDELILAVCQVPLTIEEMIVKRVLPTKSRRKIHKIKDMETELKRDGFDAKVFASAEDKRAAVEKWKILRMELEWDRNSTWYKRSMKTVKEYRVGVAHPTLLGPKDMRSNFEVLKKMKEDDQHFKDRIEDFDECLLLYETLYNYKN